MRNLENLARHKFDNEINEKVKEELLIAGIPVLRVGRLDTEVKTEYIGILNGFVFKRAWTYWVVEGYMPLNYANYIYKNFKNLNIRAGGHAGNVHPKEICIDMKYNNILFELRNKYPYDVYLKKAKQIKADQGGPKYVEFYHIDTQLGLCKLVETIKKFRIYTDFVN